MPFDFERVLALNASAGFNSWAAMRVIRAEGGEAEVQLSWKDELGQYSGFLHAGMIGALLDTTAGFAATTLVGPVIASHLSVNFMLPAVGNSFRATGRVVRSGKRQIFARSELFAYREAEERLVATGEVLLLPA
ncbi:PaaI family thioesterase [Bradyrhizobium sp. USDA 4461]